MTGKEHNEDTEDDEMTIAIEYTPLEITGLLQILDYLDVYMLQSGIPLGIVSRNRKKIYEALLKSDIREGLSEERERKSEQFEEMFGQGDDMNFPNRDGFQ